MDLSWLALEAINTSEPSIIEIPSVHPNSKSKVIKIAVLQEKNLTKFKRERRAMYIGGKIAKKLISQ